jgi:hypothetical protein
MESSGLRSGRISGPIPWGSFRTCERFVNNALDQSHFHIAQFFELALTAFFGQRSIILSDEHHQVFSNPVFVFLFEFLGLLDEPVAVLLRAFGESLFLIRWLVWLGSYYGSRDGKEPRADLVWVRDIGIEI